MVLDEAGGNPAGVEVRLFEERTVKGDGGLRPGKNELLQRTPPATDRRLAVICPDAELQQERVEVRPDLLVRPDATVDPAARPARRWGPPEPAGPRRPAAQRARRGGP